MAKPGVSIPQGTRDFGPEVVFRRNYIFSTIRAVFEKFGFQPLETPAMENLDTLMGKYGEEGDRLIFKILNNGLGDPAKWDRAKSAFEKVLSGKNDRDLTERALRYDLTIPFARYVAMNQARLAFPFKRYQMQPVWRADKPQKSRYREFYQCDADVVGSKSLINEVELTSIYAQVFAQLRIPVTIKLNSRKILAGLAEVAGGPEKLTDITVAIDKLDKTSLDAVMAELAAKGINESQQALIRSYMSISGSNEERIRQLKDLLGASRMALAGIEELEYILHWPFDEKQFVEIDFNLARGLNYYTGVIFEVKANNVSIGSIGGGGRYDDLTGLFGVPGIPGVGISFGVDRIYDVMETLELFPATVEHNTQVLFFHLGEAESRFAFDLMKSLRERNVRCELYPESVKMDKQFKYAEKKNIPYICIIGSRELEQQTCTIKDLRSREERSLSPKELREFSFQ